MTKFLEQLSKWSAYSLIAVMTTILTITALITTCHINRNEHTYYVFSSVLPLVVVLLVSWAFIFIYHLLKKHDTTPRKVYLWILLSVAFVLGCILVCYLRVNPVYDQANCLQIAADIHNGCFDEFEPTGYLQAYPQQAGLILFYYLLGFLLGPKNVLGLQIINVIAYVFFIYSIYKLTLLLWKSESIALWTAVITVLFLPLMGFTTFIYGTMLGLATSTFAIVNALDYMESRKITPAILSIISMSFAVIFKKNYLIAGIGIVLIMLIHCICKKHYRAIIVSILLMVACIVPPKAATASLEVISGYDIHDGVPSLAWVTMGLQKSTRANGWYNGFNANTYLANDCDTLVTEEISREKLNEQLQYFSENKVEALNFFIAKNTSEWAAPAFQAMHINRFYPRIEEKDSAELRNIKNFFNTYVIPFFDIFQSLIYLGACLYLICNIKKMTLNELLPAIVCLGGFLFHTIWEAKSLYVITYFVLLFPYSVKGFAAVCNAIKKIAVKVKTKDKSTGIYKNLYLYKALLPIILVVFVGVGFQCTYHYISPVKTTVKAFNEEYDSFLLNGYPKSTPTNNAPFYLKAFDQNLYLDVKHNKKSKEYSLVLNKKQEKSELISLHKMDSGTGLHFPNRKLLISAIDVPVMNSTAFRQRMSLYSSAKMWRVHQRGSNSISLVSPTGLALSRNSEGEVFYEPFNMQSINQKWKMVHSKIK